jgi:hypothetical protein
MQILVSTTRSPVAWSIKRALITRCSRHHHHPDHIHIHSQEKSFSNKTLSPPEYRQPWIQETCYLMQPYLWYVQALKYSATVLVRFWASNNIVPANWIDDPMTRRSSEDSWSADTPREFAIHKRMSTKHSFPKNLHPTQQTNISR